MCYTNPTIVIPGRCHRCGRMTDLGRFCGPCMAEINNASAHPTPPAHILPGWRCPECLTVYAPGVRMCECCKPPVDTDAVLKISGIL
jgi:uncharacterized OB-fold protein